MPLQNVDTNKKTKRKKTKIPKDEKTKRQEDKKKYPKEKKTQEFNIVMSGQGRTLAMFSYSEGIRKKNHRIQSVSQTKFICENVNPFGQADRKNSDFF